MRLSVISPEDFPAREPSVLAALFAAGLERYHVRKPHATAGELERWLHDLPREWHPRLVLHSHHHLVDTLGLGGRHWGEKNVTARTGRSAAATTAHALVSRACHDLPSLGQALGHSDIVLLSPLFSSLSKVGHGPDGRLPHEPLRSRLIHRLAVERRTQVYALGGVTAARIPLCHTLGFDGVAVLGAIWQTADPIASFVALRDACGELRSENSGGPRPLSPGETPVLR